MEFIKEEISLCKQVADIWRDKYGEEVKELKVGLYVWQEFNKSVQMIYRLDEKEKDIYTVAIETGNRKLLYWNNLEGGWLTPLLTISDCLKFLSAKRDNVIELWRTARVLKGQWICRIQSNKHWSGKSPLEACLKAVLAVLEEGK